MHTPVHIIPIPRWQTALFFHNNLKTKSFADIAWRGFF